MKTAITAILLLVLFVMCKTHMKATFEGAIVFICVLTLAFALNLLAR